MRSFIDLYIDYTRELEAPTSFWRWSAYGILAGIMRDRVAIKQPGNREVYPNMFIILVAPSGMRKSGPISLAAKLVESIANTKLIIGRSSIEAILDELGSGETSGATGKVIKGGSCLLCAEELLSFFVSSDSLVPLLTDMYDFKENWSSRLRGHEPFKIKRMCVSMLAASNEPLLRQIYTGLANNGGLLGRTFLVRPDEIRPPNALFEATEDMVSRNGQYDLKVLLSSLSELAKLSGNPIVDRAAAKVYTDWYTKLYNEYIHKSDNSGVIKRIHTSVLKLAILIGAANEYKLVIKKEHIEEAIDECLKLLPNYNSFIMSTGKLPIAEVGSLLLNELWTNKEHTISRREFLRNHWGEADVDLLDKLKITLEQAGHIKITIDGPNEFYTMTEKCIELFSKRNV